MRREFRFQVHPGEDPLERESRWDRELLELQSAGCTVSGTGPDGDYPIRYDFDSDGTMSFDEWWKGNPETPWFEVYEVVPLPSTIKRDAPAGHRVERYLKRLPQAVISGMTGIGVMAAFQSIVPALFQHSGLIA